MILNSIHPLEINAIVFLSLFCALFFLELLFAYLEKETLRRIIKLLCIPTLMVVAISLIPNHPLIYLGLFFAFLGDLFILFKSKEALVLAVIFFLTGHLLIYSEAFIYFIGPFVPWWFYLIYIISELGLIAFLYVFLKRRVKDKTLRLGGSIYYGNLFISVLVFLLAIIYSSNTYIYLGLIGYLLFILSDLLFLINKFIKPIIKNHVYIMSTYLMAELLITLGFLLTYIN